MGRIAFTLALFLASAAAADDEQGPYPYVKASWNGRYYFRMIPDPGKDRDVGGHGAAYEVEPDGKDVLLWKIEGMYAFETHLSHDGRFLVALGNWPRGHEPSDEHTAIAFYDRGKLVKRYSTKALIKNASAVRSSVSHYQYKQRVVGFSAYAYVFELVTVDGISYTFDVRDGRIVKEVRSPG